MANSGNSKVYPRFSAAKFLICPAGQWPLPQPDPDEFSSPSEPIDSSEPSYASVDVGVKPIRPKEFAEKLVSGELGIYLYGFIEYETLGTFWHRDFGYKWDIGSTEDNPMTFEHGERLCLYGDWEQDFRQKNTEYQQSQKAN